MKVKWHIFDYETKEKTGPKLSGRYWVFDAYYEGVTVGYWDYSHKEWNTQANNDDIEITHWTGMQVPEPPEGASIV